MHSFRFLTIATILLCIVPGNLYSELEESLSIKAHKYKRLSLTYYTGEDQLKDSIQTYSELRGFARKLLKKVLKKIPPGSPPCPEVAESALEQRVCYSNFLKQLSKSNRASWNVEHLRSLDSLAKFDADEFQNKNILFDLIRLVHDEKVVTKVLAILSRYHLTDAEQGIITNSLFKVDDEIVPYLLSFLAGLTELSGENSYKILTLVRYQNSTFYNTVVSALSAYSELSFVHVRNEVFNEDPLIRAAVAESMGNRSDLEIENELILSAKYSSALLNELYSINSQDALSGMSDLARYYKSVQQPYLKARVARDPSVEAFSAVQRLIYEEEFAIKRIAFSLLMNGSSTAKEAVQLILPLLHRDTNSSNLLLLKDAIHLFCRPEISIIDFRRKEVYNVIQTRSLEAIPAIRCLSTYRDPDLFDIFYSAAVEEFSLLQSEGLSALRAIWSGMTAAQQRMVCAIEAAAILKSCKTVKGEA